MFMFFIVPMRRSITAKDFEANVVIVVTFAAIDTSENGACALNALISIAEKPVHLLMNRDLECDLARCHYFMSCSDFD